ncbi:related to YSA1-sugar-nucleotide hydrolase [Ramularia collo-cygni]|uniref:Related to YSA1-sugar-nucleotide hydrolase n=1 Tax=Ramularia collo-cygni TaxID=112498 RepID=A0A2D3V7Q1_9PEZI|nr:related to YSA1-sugar-nucleotide hydrolase [Ramularia collo-cygni]CZT18594.1 related to YSA1-sugar-nucleotide hydrolase [Ramularia collo-cygni]
MSSQAPTIRRISPLPTEEAKWTELRKIEWTDQDGKDRIWEAAARKTRGKGGVDAVAIIPILRHPSRPASTMIILQYRPPVEAVCVEFPAGLIDEGETPEQAAVRELKEETGYEGKVLDCSPTIVADPGLTNANMQMVVIEVDLKEGDKEPEQHLEAGEHIERVIVPLSELHDKLQGYSNEQGKIVDARLFHWAHGLHSSTRLGLKG